MGSGWFTSLGSLMFKFQSDVLAAYQSDVNSHFVDSATSVKLHGMTKYWILIPTIWKEYKRTIIVWNELPDVYAESIIMLLASWLPDSKCRPSLTSFSYDTFSTRTEVTSMAADVQVLLKEVVTAVASEAIYYIAQVIGIYHVLCSHYRLTTRNDFFDV